MAMVLRIGHLGGCVDNWSHTMYWEGPIFHDLWRVALYEYDELKGIEWEWQAIDGRPVWLVWLLGSPTDKTGQHIHALARIKSYLDYGIFQPVQIAAIQALNGPQDCVEEIRSMYQKRRDCLIDGLVRAGWPIKKPKGTMFVWAEIPQAAKKMGSIEFAKFILQEAKVAVSPGIGFGQYGDDHVRFALIEIAWPILTTLAGLIL